MDSGVTARARTSDPNPLGPLIAVILVTAIVSGRPGLREFFSRLVRWRVGVKWYAITFATPVLLCLIAVAITFCFVPRRQLSALSIASRFQSVGGADEIDRGAIKQWQAEIRKKYQHTVEPLASTQKDDKTIVNGRFRVAKVNIDDEPALMQRFGVRAVPTLLFFSGGEMRDQIVGGAPKKTIFEKLAPLAKARHSSTKAKTSRDPSNPTGLPQILSRHSLSLHP